MNSANSFAFRRFLLSVALSGVLAGLAGLGIYRAMGPRPSVTRDMSASGAETPTTTPVTKYPPTAVRIPKIHSTLPVQAALVHGNQWDMFDTAVAWLSTSAVPGEGNVVLYAHDLKNLWGYLYKLVPGDLVEVQQNGVWLAYTVTESRAISPKDIGAIISDNNQLTMYTCEGTFDQKRRLVYAVPR